MNLKAVAIQIQRVALT